MDGSDNIGIWCYELSGNTGFCLSNKLYLTKYNVLSGISVRDFNSLGYLCLRWSRAWYCSHKHILLQGGCLLSSKHLGGSPESSSSHSMITSDDGVSSVSVVSEWLRFGVRMLSLSGPQLNRPQVVLILILIGLGLNHNVQISDKGISNPRFFQGSSSVFWSLPA